MKQAYLFIHFREKTTPDGEQVYFALSRDGFHWETVNDGRPVLWAYYGDKGVRDHTIMRAGEHFVILATDLSLSYGMRSQYHRSWEEVAQKGSKQLALWESDDLIHWTEQQLVSPADETFGCVWAPDICESETPGEYIVHWSSSNSADGYADKCIYFARTRDFHTFTPPQLLYAKPGTRVIDSAIYREDDWYYLFVKSEKDPCRIMELRSREVTGPWERVTAFDKAMEQIVEGKYEAPTAVRLEDGRWCLFLDYYGVKGAGQGYVPFVADTLASGDFIRSDAAFDFPYGFKHGTILTITPEEYERIKAHSWEE